MMLAYMEYVGLAFAWFLLNIKFMNLWQSEQRFILPTFLWYILGGSQPIYNIQFIRCPLSPLEHQHQQQQTHTTGTKTKEKDEKNNTHILNFAPRWVSHAFHGERANEKREAIAHKHGLSVEPVNDGIYGALCGTQCAGKCFARCKDIKY